MNVQRHATNALIVALLASLLGGCAALRTPTPLTTLQLLAADPPLAWPASLALGRVDAVAALQGERMLVVDGGLLMQHGSLRWAAAPPVLLQERLRGARATGAAATGDTKSVAGMADPVATLDLWLSHFELRLVAGGGREAVVTAAAELRCRSAQQGRTIAAVESVGALASEDAQAMAASFTRASDRVLGALLEAASTQLAACAAVPAR